MRFDECVCDVTLQYGVGYTSSTITVLTSQAAPTGPPQTVNTNVLSSQSILVSWTAPLIYLQNGAIINYLVNYTRVDGQYRANTTRPASVIVTVAYVYSTDFYSLS